MQVIRGKIPLRVECAPAFNYARSPHTTEILIDTSVASSSPSSPIGPHHKALFASSEANLTLDLRYLGESSLDNVGEPEIELHELDLEARGHKGTGVWTEITLREGQAVTFVLRTPPNVQLPPQAHPTHQTARELGIPYESEFDVTWDSDHIRPLISRVCQSLLLAHPPCVLPRTRS